MMKNNKYIIGGGLVVTLIYGYYRIYSFDKKMDKKYTPIWLKSTGKLDK